MLNYTYRHATTKDVNIIANQRYLMFREIGKVTDDVLENAHIHYVSWLKEKLEIGDYKGVLVEYEQSVIGGGGMWIGYGEPLPLPNSSDLRRATIVNVYTAPEHRRQGIARNLMNRLLEIARVENYPVVQLVASEAGQPLYESLGFHPRNDMSIYL